MTQEELDKIVEQHQHWLKEDCEGWEDMRANLRGADEFRLGKVLDEPLTGYKKTKEGVVITAEIPIGAIVFCINGSKCRTNRAKEKNMCEENKNNEKEIPGNLFEMLNRIRKKHEEHRARKS